MFVILGGLLTIGSALLWAHDDTVIAELLEARDDEACSLAELSRSRAAGLVRVHASHSARQFGPCLYVEGAQVA